MLTWNARVLGHVADFSLVQVPGGLLLVAGTSRPVGSLATVLGFEGGDSPAMAQDLGLFNVDIAGGAAVLTDTTNSPRTALYLRPGETLPPRVHLWLTNADPKDFGIGTRCPEVSGLDVYLALVGLTG